MSMNDDVIEAEIFRLLSERSDSSSICPSDVARSLGNEDSWRELMDPVRAVAAQLAKDGRVRVTQGQETVDVETAKGPVRIRRP